MTMYPGGYYSYGYTAPSAGEGILGVFLGMYLFVVMLALLFSVALYVLQSLAYYQIAKRRGIRNPWLSWIPGGNLWIIGSVSDQYQYVRHGKVKNRRKILLGLYFAYLAASVLYLVMAVVLGVWAGTTGSTAPDGMMIMGVLLFALIMMAVGITMTVFQYIALYDTFASCDPSNAVLYLLLSIFINVTMPFFLFSCRKRDDGMPPRRTAIGQQPAAPQPHPDWVRTHAPQPAAAQYDPAWKPEEPTPAPVLPEEPAVPAPEEESTATLPEKTDE